MFIIIEETVRGSALQGQPESAQSLRPRAEPGTPGKAINADGAERCQVEEGQRKMIKVLFRGTISFWFSGSPYFSPNMEQGNFLVLRGRILKGIKKTQSVRQSAQQVQSRFPQ